MYKHPGVYIEHVPSGVLAIEAASTSVAAFIGQVKRGDLVTSDKDKGKPVFISSASQFAQKFGVLNDGAAGIRDEDQKADYFGHAVNAFFSNGGTQAYIVPVGDGDGDSSTGSLVDPHDSTKGFYFKAKSDGTWADGLIVRISRTVNDGDPGKRVYSVELGINDDSGNFEPIESFDGLSLSPDSGSFLVARINNASELVSVEHLDIATAGGGQVSAIMSSSLAEFDPSQIGGSDSLTLKVNTSSIAVSFSGSESSLEQIADLIQQTVRAASPGPTGKEAFLAQVTRDRRILMVPGPGATSPSVAVEGSATAVKLGLDPTVYRGAKVQGFDGASLDGKTLDLKVGGTAFTVTLAAPMNDLAAVATQIQAQAQGNPNNLTKFSAHADADNRIVLRIDEGDAGDAVSVTGGDAQAALGLDDAEGAIAGRPVVLEYPQPFDTTKGAAESQMKGGKDHGAAAKAQYTDALNRLKDYRDVSIILLPGKTWQGTDKAFIEEAITHSEFMKNRMVVVDPPNPGEGTKLESPTDVKDLQATTSPYTALYYPWVEVSNPHYDPDTAATKPKKFAIPPSGFAAGMWARIDGRRGVWKAPAGLEATVRGTLGPNVLIGNNLQDNLNEWGVNCLRAIVGPTVIWGARTLATKSKPEFRYVPVRRTQNMIGESLYNALQAVVFEPNDHKLWASLRASTTDFMDGLHRAGAFQGEKASDAYYVRCGLGSTMTQGDIDAGIVRLVVGFAPLKPAEFVVVQIKQIVGQTA